MSRRACARGCTDLQPAAKTEEVPIKTRQFPCSILPLLAVFLAVAPVRVRAQDLKLHPTPFTTYLDFAALADSSSARRSFPIWLESFEIEPVTSATGKIEKTTFRLRFRKFAGLNEELLLRLFFDDTQRPSVGAWSEVGTAVVPAQALGSGLGLPTSETLVFAMNAVDYIDIDVPGDGTNVHGALVSSLQTTTVRSALDFSPPDALSDPFGNAASARLGTDDAFLFGAVKATIESGAVTLSPENKNATAFEFELANQPLLALVTFEILNADVAAAPEITVNTKALGSVTIVWPDLADPGFRATSQPMQDDLTFHYSGWLKCQKAIPGSALRSGINSLSVQSAGGSAAVAIRAVEVQLKYENERP